MIHHTGFRQIKKSFFFSIVKFLSLFLGFSIVIVVVEWVDKESSYDNFWKNKNRIYRVALQQYRSKDLQFGIASNYRGLTDLMLRELPEVEGRVRLHRDRVTVFTPNIQIQDVDMFYTDTCIFDVLDRKILACASTKLFPDLQSILISESLSHKLYGSENPIGKTLKLNEGWKFYVNGIFEDVPDNSHISFDLLMTIPSLHYYMSHFNNTKGVLNENEKFEYNEPGPYDRRSWNAFFGYSYILVKEGTRIDDLKKKTDLLITPEKLPLPDKNTRLELIFQPLTSIHLHSGLEGELKMNGSQFKVYAMILVAFVVMFISIVNCINLSVIDFYDQVSYSAIRLIHGASLVKLLKSFFIKELILSLAAGVSAYILTFYSLKLILPATIPGPGSIIIILILAITVALLTLIFPYYQVKSHTVFDLLKKRIITTGTGKAARVFLVSLQFGISLFLIAGTIAIFSQLRYIQKKNPGFIPDSVIYSYSPMTMNQRPDIQEKLQVFRNKLKSIPGVSDFCTSSSIPGKDFLLNSDNVSLSTEDPDKKTHYQILNADYEYLETIGLTIVSGRNFIRSNVFPGNEVILNQLAVKKLGFKDPSDAPGKAIRVDGRNYIICGVVSDFHHLSFKQALSPVIIFKSLDWPYAVGYYSYKVTGSDFQGTVSQIEKAWTETYPGEKFLYRFLGNNYQEQYKAEHNFSKSVTSGSILAIIISCLGLLGYARYNAVKSIKEIGVRKAFGASRFDIILLFTNETLRIICISAILSLPLAWIVADKWLMNFAYRIDLSVWMFLIAIAITTLIAVLSTLYITWRSSLRCPIEALKHE
jgi:putative ABC transport system permease protein